METVISVGLFIIGFYILIKGAHVLVRGASSVATILGLSKWFIGAVIVGIGTSIPELAINIASAFNGQNIGLAAIIGSHTFNSLFLLGIVAVITPLTLHHSWIYRDVPINVGAILIAVSMILFPVFGPALFLGITRTEGIVMIGLLLTWFIYMLSRRSVAESKTDFRVFTISSSLFMILIGFVGVFLGGRWVISGAETLANLVGFSSAFIGFTVVAIGTSLPELTISTVAAFRKETGLALGNILGSNVFGLLGVLGIASVIRPLAVLEGLRFDIFATLGAAMLLTFTAVFLGKRFTISRFEGVLLAVTYILYVVFLVIRG